MFCAKGPTDLLYDVVYLGRSTGIMLAVHGSLDTPDPAQTCSLPCTMSFVLKPKGDDPEDGYVRNFGAYLSLLITLPHSLTEEVWPFVAVAHQIVVREL